MNVTPTALPEVLVVEPRVFADDRGHFLETFSASKYAAAGLPGAFVQDNLSSSRRGVLRGLHFQEPHPQGKLVYAIAGEIWDVAVDIRVGSPRFLQWVGVTLSGEDRRQVYVPPGFAHGFVVLSESALVAYKCTEAYRPEAEASLPWDDPRIGIAWPVDSPLLSPKDRAAPRVDDMPEGRLPRYAG